MRHLPPAYRRRTRRGRLMRLVRLALLVAFVVGVGAGAWLWHQQDQKRGLMEAGSDRIVSPIGGIQLIGQMCSTAGAGATDASDGLAADQVDVSDSRIHLQVSRKLQQMNLSREQIEVRIDDGIVTLEGVVSDRTTRDAYEITVRTVEGVREVDNRIELSTDE